MFQITKDSVQNAILYIDQNPDILKGRESKDYDLVLDNGKTYPPILVLSEANRLLGGEPLVISDFYNSTRKPFKILRDLGFIISPKFIHKSSNSDNSFKEPFDINRFLQNCQSSNLFISEQLAIRFISSLITKPFVILIGLSGSGKTMLALAFAKWITNTTYTSIFKRFSNRDEVNSDRVTYVVTASDTISATFTQRETNTKVTLPYELIYEWMDAIQENKFSNETSPRIIREQVAKTTKYSSQLNSFETHLKAAALHLIFNNSTSIEAPAISLVPVGADWTNREPLLGYPNALKSKEYILPENGVLQLIIQASNNPNQPYFLILDEMNLSHVERYFADFLSSMESKEPIPLHSGNDNWNDVPPAIKLPKNLFIIGTVNIDETTYMFSPKVLDRANVIEFRIDEKEMKNFLSNNIKVELKNLEGKGVSMATHFLDISQNDVFETQPYESIGQDLLAFFSELKKLGTEFGYRTASEIFKFYAVVKFIKNTWTKEQILDAAIMQKLLPKVHGSRRKLEPILRLLAELCVYDKTVFSDVLNLKNEIDFNDVNTIKFPISLQKIRSMQNSLINNGFTSYAEA